MDNVTHTLFALTLARTPIGRVGRGTTAVLVLASNAPDIDIVSTIGGAAGYMRWHRGPTHGLLGIVGLGVAVATIVWSVAQVRSARDRRIAPPASLPGLIAVAMLGVLLHVAMDFPTSYGTRLFSPFDWHWFAVDWLPIVDIYLLAALAAALVFGQVRPDARRRNAAIALFLMAGNYALRGYAHHRALELAPAVMASILPPQCGGAGAHGSIDRWPAAATASAVDGRPCLMEIAAMPTFLSPFRWRVVARSSNAYQMEDIDLLDERLASFSTDAAASRTTLRIPDQWIPATAVAAATRTGRTFLGFSRFPDARAFVDPQGTATIRFNDMRFAGGLLAVAQSPPRPAPFAVVVRVAADGRVLQERMER